MLIAWRERWKGHFPRLALLHSVPNGGWRAPKTASQMKAEGALPGVSDLHLPVARRRLGSDRGPDGSGYYHSLFIEMKRLKGGTVLASQREWLEAMRAEGHKAEVCKGRDAARDLIVAYLGLPDAVRDDWATYFNLL